MRLCWPLLSVSNKIGEWLGERPIRRSGTRIWNVQCRYWISSLVLTERWWNFFVYDESVGKFVRSFVGSVICCRETLVDGQNFPIFLENLVIWSVDPQIFTLKKDFYGTRFFGVWTWNFWQPWFFSGWPPDGFFWFMVIQLFSGCHTEKNQGCQNMMF